MSTCWNVVMPARWLVGETLEQALAALKRELAGEGNE